MATWVVKPRLSERLLSRCEQRVESQCHLGSTAHCGPEAPPLYGTEAFASERQPGEVGARGVHPPHPIAAKPPKEAGRRRGDTTVALRQNQVPKRKPDRPSFSCIFGRAKLMDTSW